MTELQRFCTEFKIGEVDAERTLLLARREEGSALAVPWYARMVVGIGAWITAIIAVFLGGMILVALGAEDYDSGALVMGIIYLGFGLWWLRNTEGRLYATQLGVAVCAAGSALIALGVGLVTEDLWATTLASAAMTALIITTTSQRTLQFLAALLTAVLFIGALLEQNIPFYFDIVAIAGPVGVALLLWPPKRDMEPTAVALLLLLPVFAIFGGVDTMFWQVSKAGGWFAKVLHIVIFLWLVVLHGQRISTTDVRTRLTIFAIAAVVVSVLLPPGGSAALVILMLGFVLGSRGLALCGVLLQIHYIWRFYYDMDLTLLAKSGMLIAVGIVLLITWWLMQRHTPEEVRE